MSNFYLCVFRNISPTRTLAAFLGSPKMSLQACRGGNSWTWRKRRGCFDVYHCTAGARLFSNACFIILIEFLLSLNHFGTKFLWYFTITGTLIMKYNPLFNCAWFQQFHYRIEHLTQENFSTSKMIENIV